MSVSESVAVIIPVYNGQRFVRCALDSVAAQARPPEELIVVDDGSTDGSDATVERWARDRHATVKLVRRPHQGLAAARNAGIAQATTTLVALLDADDEWLPHHLATLLHGYRIDPDIALSFADAESFRANQVVRGSYLRDSVIAALPYDELSGVRFIRGSAYSGLVGGSPIANCSTLLSRAAANSVGLYDEAFEVAQDREFWLRLSKSGRFAYVPQIVSRVRRHSSNVTHSKHALRSLDCRLRVLEKMLRIGREIGLSDPELALTRGCVAMVLNRILYAASRRGLASYWRQSWQLFERGYWQPLRAPKSACRAGLASAGMLATSR